VLSKIDMIANSRLVSEPSSIFHLNKKLGGLAADRPILIIVTIPKFFILATHTLLSMLGKLSLRGFQQFGNFANVI